jgi:uncharacterized protein with HEPN domain
MTDVRGDAAYLWDVYDAACDVREFVAGRTWEEYQSQKMLRAAVERKVEIIGEAARSVSDAFKDSQPLIPWRAHRGPAARLAHEYATILNAKIWQVATVHVPALITMLEPLLPVKPGAVAGNTPSVPPATLEAPPAPSSPDAGGKPEATKPPVP